MKITILGCGTSVGIPALGRAGWGSCDPNNPKNRRQRCAILVQTDNTTVLVDAGPDIKNQLLPLNIRKLDAVLITHTHSDHVAGMDDLRIFYWPDEKKLNLFQGLLMHLILPMEGILGLVEKVLRFLKIRYIRYQLYLLFRQHIIRIYIFI